MKNLFLYLIALGVTGCVSNAQVTEKEIGIDVDGVYKITADEEFLKTTLEAQLRKDDNEAVLTKFEIKKDFVENRPSEEYYILLAQNEEGSTKIASELQLNSNSRFIALMYSDQFDETVTCSGSCTIGCDPRRYVTDDGFIAWLCTSCTQPSKTCNKSVTDH